MSRSLKILVFGAAVASGNAVAFGQTSRDVSPRATCPTCKVELQRVMVVGDSAGPGMVHEQGLVFRNRNGDVYVTSKFDLGSVRRFSSAGRFLNAVGRRGSGPGEWTGRPELNFLSRGRILVVDAMARRATMLDSAGRVRSTAILPLFAMRTIAFDGGQMLVTDDGGSPARNRMPLHLLESSGAIVRSFGATGEQVDLRTGSNPFRVLGESDKPGMFWSARTNTYRMERWDTTGRNDIRLHRSVDWFPAVWTEPEGLIGVKPQPPTITALFERADSLWVFVRVNDAKWRAMPPVPFQGMKNAHYTPDSYRERLFDTIVEVFHVPTGRLVTSQRLPQHLVGVDSNGYAFSYEEDDEGNPRYAVWRLAVRVTN